MDSARKMDWQKPGFKANHRAVLPPPRVPGEKPVVDKTLVVPPDDKLSALRANRRVRGLCERCAEKWVRGHKCAATIKLQAIQEVWDLFQSG